MLNKIVHTWQAAGAHKLDLMPFLRRVEITKDSDQELISPLNILHGHAMWSLILLKSEYMATVAGFLVGHQPSPKLWHRDLLLVLNAHLILCLSY